MAELAQPLANGNLQGEALKALTHISRTKQERLKLIKHLQPLLDDIYRNQLVYNFNLHKFLQLFAENCFYSEIEVYEMDIAQLMLDNLQNCQLSSAHAIQL